MTKTPLTRLIVSLGIPTTISMLITNIYNMADTYFVGTLGESQQAATGILFALQAIIQAIAFMLGQGGGTMVSKALADSDKNAADRYVSTAFFTSIAVGSLFLIVGLLSLNPLLYLLGSTKTILPHARQYGACVLLSCPVVMGSFVLNNSLRYEGKAFYAMIGLVSGGLINILGDYLLVMVFPLGVLGAGIATAVSQLISFILLLVFFNKKAQSKISLSAISRDIRVLLVIMKVGFPSLIRQSLASISHGMLNNLTRPFGDAAIAAMSVVNRISAFVMCVGLGIGQGYQPVASFNYQAGEYKRVKLGLLVTMGIGMVCISFISVPCVIFSKEIIRIFQDSAQVAKIGVPALKYACIGTMFLSLSVPINMLYQSTRRAGIASFLSVLRSGLLFIPVLLLTTSFFGILGIEISQPIADILTGLISIPFILHFLIKDKGPKHLS
ncbi:MAG: MATE family efflux transporter [Oscillospiraceae bacterium]|nr:MATE family efflux transporter [Oscillospiraceae bacterium]